ncbi:MAG: RNA polymerase sigma factor [Bacteroidia bacterium]
MTKKEHNQFIALYADELYRFIKGHLRDYHWTKDVQQEVFKQLWEERDKVDIKKVKPYLFQAANHTLINQKKRDTFRKQADTEGFDETVHPKEYPDVRDIVEEAMDLLPVDEKAVAHLRIFGNYEYQEIAELLDMSYDEVKKKVFRARLALKRYLGKVENLL